MAFVRKNFERVGGGVQKLFMYAAGADTIATVDTDAYFNEVADEIDAGDVIICKTNNNATLDNLMVTSARSVKPVVTVGLEGLAAD